MASNCKKRKEVQKHKTRKRNQSFHVGFQFSPLAVYQFFPSVIAQHTLSLRFVQIEQKLCFFQVVVSLLLPQLGSGELTVAARQKRNMWLMQMIIHTVGSTLHTNSSCEENVDSWRQSSFGLNLTHNGLSWKSASARTMLKIRAGEASMSSENFVWFLADWRRLLFRPSRSYTMESAWKERQSSHKTNQWTGWNTKKMKLLPLSFQFV